MRQKPLPMIMGLLVNLNLFVLLCQSGHFRIEGLSFPAIPTDRMSSSMTSHAALKRAIFNYEPANEYMKEMYDKTSYFDTSPGQAEMLHNARQGIWQRQGAKEVLVEASLASCGFCLVPNLSDHNSHMITDWNDPAQLRHFFLPRARRAILQATQGTLVHDMVFWQPTIRTSPASYVTPVHIDMDMNAYQTVDEMLDFVWSCRIPEEEQDDDSETQRARWKHAIGDQGRRFCLTNVWCPMDTDNQAAIANPLALFRPDYEKHLHDLNHANGHYGDIASALFDDLELADQDKSSSSWLTSPLTSASPLPPSLLVRGNIEMQALPHAQPHLPTSKWYNFPNMTAGEMLVFTQYDRDVRGPSDVWHCAVNTTIEEGEDSGSAPPARRSFDIRCLVLCDERVPFLFDRWANKLPLCTATLS